MRKNGGRIIAILVLITLISIYIPYISMAVEIEIENQAEENKITDILQENNETTQNDKKDETIEERVQTEIGESPVILDKNNGDNKKEPTEKLTLNDQDSKVLAPEEENILITDHSAYSHTKEEIIQKYRDSQPTYDGSVFYDETPNYTTAPYSEGKLNNEILQDTLKLVNYYRWLSGLNDLSLNEEWIAKSQRGALLMKVNNVFAHQQSKPDGMDSDIYSDGAEACLKSNIAWTSLESGNLIGSVLGYVNDDGNVEPNVGHRVHLFQPNGKYASMGQCYNYSTIHVETTSSSNGNNDVFYSWPVPGYQEATGFAKEARWSITLNSDKYILRNVKNIKVTISVDGKDYEVTPKFWESNTIFYDLPDELKNSLSGNQDYIIDGKKAKVRVEGLYGTESRKNNVSIEYETEFFYQEKILTEEVNIFNTDDINEMWGHYINNNSTVYVDESKKSTYILPFFLPEDATDRRVDIEISDTSIISMEDITNQEEGYYGTNIYKITGKKVGKTDITMTRVADGKELIRFTVNSKVEEEQEYKLGDVNGDGKINVIDCTAILKHIKGTKLLSSEEQARADINKDKKINVIDCTAILKHIKGTKLIEE